MNKRHRLDLLIAGMIFLLAFGWRLWHMMRLEIWFDEAYSSIAVSGGWSDVWRMIYTQAQPPLHYLSLKIWAILAGHNDYSLRFIQAVLGAIIPAAAFLWLRSRTVAQSLVVSLATALLLTLNPFLTQYSQEIRYYAQSTALLFVASAIAFYLATKKDLRTKSWLLVGCLLSLAWLTHYTALFVIVPLYLLLRAWLYPVVVPAERRSMLLGVLLPLEIGTLLLIKPIIWSFWTGAKYITWVAPMSPDFITSSLWSFLVGVQRHSNGLTPALFGAGTFWPVIVVITLLLLGVWAIWRQRAIEDRLYWYATGLWVGILATAALFSLVVSPLWLPRYIMSAGVWFIIWIVLTVFRLPRRSVATLVLVGLCLLGLIGHESVDRNPEWMAERIAAQPGDYPLSAPYNVTMTCFFLDRSTFMTIVQSSATPQCQLSNGTSVYVESKE